MSRVEHQRSVDQRENQPMGLPKIAIVLDREGTNLMALIQQQEFLRLCGIVAAGGELDKDIMAYMSHINGLKPLENKIPLEWDGAIKATGFSFNPFSDEKDLPYYRLPYDPEALQTNPNYRFEYCKELADILETMDPNYILLSNYKIYLDPLVVERFAGKIINIHPSFLPLLKGYKPENRAINGEDPDYCGYTMHFVDVDLDGGATIFQQRVKIDPYNEALENTYIAKFGRRQGKKEYAWHQEEILRQKIIKAQAKYSAKVMGLLAYNYPRKTVSDKEAFAYEGRPDFINSPAYKDALYKEYLEWKEKNKQPTKYREWHRKHRKKYERVLFDIGNGWTTAERILGAADYADVTIENPLTRYIVRVDHTNIRAIIELGKLEAQIHLSGEGGTDVGFVNYADQTFNITLTTTLDVKSALIPFGVTPIEEPLLTRVGAPRSPIEPTFDLGAFPKENIVVDLTKKSEVRVV